MELAMPQSIFISYRRSDAQHAAFAIADRLRWAFGPEEIFMDRSSIESGDDWPDSLRRGVEAAKVMVIVIGPTWLTAQGNWGRRRIDDPQDWVRKEVCAGLQRAPQRPGGRYENVADASVYEGEFQDGAYHGFQSRVVIGLQNPIP